METKKYTYSEALAASHAYFCYNRISAEVFVDKYALRDEDDNILEGVPGDMHDRLAKEFARIDSEKYKLDFDDRFTTYRDALDKFARIVPSGGVMSAVGNKNQYMSASNCVVVEPPVDSIGGIFDTGKALAQLFKRRCGVGTDLSSLRPEKASVTNAAKTSSGAWSFANLYSNITGMICQCIAEGERVLTNSGLKEIQDVVAGSDKVWTKKGWITVSDVLFGGEKQTYRITSKYGLEINASEDHVFLTEADGKLCEKKLSEFSVGDPIILIPGRPAIRDLYELDTPKYIKRSCNNSNRLNENVCLPHHLDHNLAYLLGYMYGDGSIEFDKFDEPAVISLACGHAWPKIQDRLVELIKNIFGYDAKIKPGDGAVNKVQVHSKIIAGWLKHNDILKQYSSKIKFPQAILLGPSHVQMAFLSGFFDADGYNGRTKKGYIFSTTSNSFARNIQTVLIANGIISKLHKEDRSLRGWKSLYSVAVTGRHAQIRFVELMSSEKVYFNPSIARSDRNLTPYKARSLDVSHNKYPYIPDNSQYISANAYNKLKKEASDNITDELLIKSTVKNIEEGGFYNTYDLSLEEEHLFWCEGFYIHNSGRRGACMLTMDVHHPDVLQFIKMKSDKTRVTNANVSVKLSNDFLKAVERDAEYEVRWPLQGEPRITGHLNAKEVFDKITMHAAKDGDPGIMFWDNICDNLPAQNYEQFQTVTTNPCGEVPLSSYDSCRLMSINLTAYVRNPFESSANFDFNAFTKDIKTAMQMIDNLVDLEIELIDRIKTICDKGFETDIWDRLQTSGKLGRRTGLGTHGLADTLAQLCIKYDSDDALTMIEKIYRKLRDEAYQASIELAKIRGPFPIFDWEKEKNNKFIKRLPKKIRDELEKYGRRNISILTQAPTGSVSIVSKLGNFDAYNISSGIEPVFQNEYIRNRKINPDDENVRVDFVDEDNNSWQRYKIQHSNVLCYLEKFNAKKGDLPDYFVTSDQIGWEKRVELQGAEQKYIDHSISSTINLPRNTEPQVIADIYWYAWKNNLKGITVYVEGTKGAAVLASGLDENGRPIKIVSASAPKRPRELSCEIHYATVKGTKWAILVGLLHNDPFEIFMWEAEKLNIPPRIKEGKIVKVKKGIYSLMENNNAPVIDDIVKTAEEEDGAWTTRMMSMSLRHGIPVNYLVDQLSKDGSVVDINNVLSRLLRRYIKKKEQSKGESCPQCGSSMIYSEGCKKCSSCSYSGCG